VSDDLRYAIPQQLRFLQIALFTRTDRKTSIGLKENHQATALRQTFATYRELLLADGHPSLACDKNGKSTGAAMGRLLYTTMNPSLSAHGEW